MNDDTREVRLGDLSAVGSADGGFRQPGFGDAVAAAPAGKEFPAARRGVEAPWPLLALAFSVVVLTGIVVLLFNQMATLRDALATVEARSTASVATLESQVASTSTSMRSTDAETQKSLNLLAADIKRLNDGLNRLARALEAEAQARTSVGKDLATLAHQVRESAQAGAKAGADQQSKTDARLRAVADNLEQLAARQKTQADALARLERSGDTAQLRADVGVLGASVRQLQEDHERRLKAAEQASASNDAFRRQVNATIDRLQQQVGELYPRR